MKDNEGILARNINTERILTKNLQNLQSLQETNGLLRGNVIIDVRGKVIIDESEWLIMRDVIFQPTVAKGLLPEVFEKYPEIMSLVYRFQPSSKYTPLGMGLHSPVIDNTTEPPKGDEEPTILYTEGDKVAIATLYNAMWGQSFAINDPETAMKQTIELYNKTIKNI